MNPWSRFREIKAALDSADIEGLVALGCPPDEYANEASLIESQMARLTEFGKKEITVKQCEQIVIDVWIAQFGPFKAEDLEMRCAAFSVVAQKIAASQ
jgi:hypothetical protein